MELRRRPPPKVWPAEVVDSWSFLHHWRAGASAPGHSRLVRDKVGTIWAGWVWASP